MKIIDGVKYSNDLKTVIGVTIERKISESPMKILDGVTDISQRALAECRFEEIFIPDSVKNIRKTAFINCSRLKSISIPNVRIINEAALKNCTSLTSLNAPNVEIIEELGLAGCGFKELPNLPKLKYIGMCAFEGCGNLNYVFINENVEYIEEDAFFDCISIKEIEVHKNNKYYDSRNDCNALINTVENTLIRACINTVIPDSVCTLAGTAFQIPNIKKIVIPEGVKSLVGEPFFECNGLEDLYLPGTIESFDIHTFHEFSEKATIHYAGTREQFKEIEFYDYIPEEIKDIRYIETLKEAIDVGKTFRQANDILKGR